ncbi:MAG: lipid-A-disaccharide synthase [Pseudomonadota bacterium]
MTNVSASEQNQPLKIYFVIGEESGDALGSKLIDTFKHMNVDVAAVGLAGPRMQERGMSSLYDVSELSVMGISGVVAKLPGLLRRISQTAADVIKQNPDVLLLIDSPDFSYRVAKKVRKQKPDIKIIKYVSPSVWAWRPGRAKKISTFIDHVLAILPFEPDLLKELGGPEATFVGHPLAAEMPEVDKAARQNIGTPPRMVLLPGSRQSEIKRLLPFIKETLDVLKERGNEFEITLPAVTRFADEIREAVKLWAYPVEVVTGDEARVKAFRKTDFALAASGTVTLELALYRVPMISIYRLDFMAMQIRHMLTGWTASLPNLIADYPVVPERFNEYAHPQYVARMVEKLVRPGHERDIQLEGFELIRQRMAQEAPSHEVAARKIIEVSKEKAGI